MKQFLVDVKFINLLLDAANGVSSLGWAEVYAHNDDKHKNAILEKTEKSISELLTYVYLKGLSEGQTIISEEELEHVGNLAKSYKNVMEAYYESEREGGGIGSVVKFYSSVQEVINRTVTEEYSSKAVVSIHKEAQKYDTLEREE